MTQHTWTEKLKEEGFTHIRLAKLEPNYDAGEHIHEEETVHVILTGEITITDEVGSTTVIEGDRFDIHAGTTHSVKAGPDGCTMLVGSK